MTTLRPLFIFSLPRAGSTLLQRLLSLHEDISSCPEPWVALPPLVGLEANAARAIYGHAPMANALSGFVDELPGGNAEYMSRVAEFVDGLYSSVAGSRKGYFLDKTPRYHLIAAMLMKMFPDGKFIFLWRNPLAIAASMINTWGKGRWNLYRYTVDLYLGLERLTEALEIDADKIEVRYEDVVSQPDIETNRIFDFLSLDRLDQITERFERSPAIMAPGRGDPTGQYIYKTISSASHNQWVRMFSNPLRRHWAMRYLDWIGSETMELMGYDNKQLKEQLHDAPIQLTSSLSDVLRMPYGYFRNRFGISVNYHPLMVRGNIIGESD